MPDLLDRPRIDKSAESGLQEAEVSRRVVQRAGKNSRSPIKKSCSVTLQPGNIASFPKGATSTWTVRRTLRKFFVISG